MEPKEILLPTKCVQCEGEIKNQGNITCLKCGDVCGIKPQDPSIFDTMQEGEMGSFNAKSLCCGADIKLNNVRSTCSDECHEKFMEKTIAQIGPNIYEKDINGEIRIIPTRYILEKGGLTEEEIMQFPKMNKPAEA